MSNLFDLNDRIFAAMDELDAADDEHMEQAIEKARTKVQLFSAAINATNVIAKVANMQEATMDGLAMKVGASRILLGQPQVVADMERRALPGFDALAWVAEFAPGHTLSWTRDRLNKYGGADYTFDEVRALCDEARVECVELDADGGKWTSDDMTVVGR